MHAKSISKILACEYVKKHIKSQCEYHMKVYGYNPLDNPPQKCDNIPRLKGRISPMTYAHSRSGSSTSDWQTLQDHCKAVAALSESRVVGKETDLSHVSCLLPCTACVPNDDVALAREGQSLVSHLEGVASLAQRFAAPFGLFKVIRILYKTQRMNLKS